MEAQRMTRKDLLKGRITDVGSAHRRNSRKRAEKKKKRFFFFGRKALTNLLQTQE
jgi:hypothetical protein